LKKGGKKLIKYKKLSKSYKPSQLIRPLDDAVEQLNFAPGVRFDREVTKEEAYCKIIPCKKPVFKMFSIFGHL